MKLTSRELVDIKFAVMEALGLDESILKLNELIRIHEQSNIPLNKVLRIAQGELERNRDSAWINVLLVCERYLKPPYREVESLGQMGPAAGKSTPDSMLGAR